MRPRWGLGPVFAYESMVRSRRWQGYAARAGFLLAVLAALALIRASSGSPVDESPRRLLERTAREFFEAMAVTQLALVMLAAPAATAGAICLDRARGSLAHLLTTDLSDREIVLGKLAARLVPVLALLGCTLPVVAIAGLLGGVDLVAVAAATLATAGLAMLGCSLALVLSTWLAKTHEVMSVVFALWAVWLLSVPIIDQFGGTSPVWLRGVHPIKATFAAGVSGGVDWPVPVRFFAGCLVVSVGLTWLAVRELRPAYRRQLGRKPRPVVEGRVLRRFRHDVPWWPSPSLDRNPVLWREWHRDRPSRPARVVWMLYGGISLVLSVWVVANRFLATPGAMNNDRAATINAVQALFGLLLLSVSAATTLAEERVRGSLDVLMVTPLPTSAIVWGKWWGAYRRVLLLAILPLTISIGFVWARPTPPGVVPAAYLVPALILAHGAAVTSLGLALATWTAKLGRAVAGTVAAFLIVTVAGPLFGSMIKRGDPTDLPTMMTFLSSPAFNIAVLTSVLEQPNAGPDAIQTNILLGSLALLGINVLVAGFLLVLTLATFDHCLGRSPEAPRPEPVRGSDSRTPGGEGQPESGGGSSGQRPR